MRIQRKPTNIQRRPKVIQLLATLVLYYPRKATRSRRRPSSSLLSLYASSSFSSSHASSPCKSTVQPAATSPPTSPLSRRGGSTESGRPEASSPHTDTPPAPPHSETTAWRQTATIDRRMWRGGRIAESQCRDPSSKYRITFCEETINNSLRHSYNQFVTDLKFCSRARSVERSSSEVTKGTSVLLAPSVRSGLAAHPSPFSKQ
jgi:hypothetical protein